VRRRRVPAAFESPLLVGSVILAVGLIGVILSYNANKGLPFAPTYQVFVDVPDAAELTAANSEVRIRGTRVGLVKEIRAMPPRGSRPAFARLSLALDPGVPRLPVDSQVDVRPRSVLGAKYLEVIPGRSRRTLAEGGLLPVSRARAVVEFDEAFNVFDRETAAGLRNSVTVMGDALAGRGEALNRSALTVRRMLGPMQQVMATFADPATDLEGFIRGAAATMRALVPVSHTFARMIDRGATTLAAIDVARGRFGETIEELPETEIVTIRAARTINPVLDDAAAIAREIRPGSELIKPTSRDLADAVDVAIPVLERTPPLAKRLDEGLKALDVLVRNTRANDVLDGLYAATTTLRSTLHDVAPAQTRCNVLGLYGRNLTSVVTEGDADGTWLNNLLIADFEQTFQSKEPAANLHLNFYPHENDRECEAGNEPFEPGQRIGNPPGRQSSHVPNSGP
jgi:virulence factor Mce-like protein